MPSAGEDRPQVTSQNIRVLLVEDNPADARLLREAVRDAGQFHWQLVHEDRLAKGLHRLEIEPFDVVLLDLSLPDADGLESVDRTHAHKPEIPIVVLTGLDDEGIALTAVRRGAQDYLVKGDVTGNLLVRSIRYAMERREAIERIQKSEEYYRSLIENALDIILVLNEDGTVRYASPATKRILGYSPQLLHQSSVFELLHPDDATSVRTLFTTLLGLPGMTQQVELRVRHRDGGYRVLEAIAKNLAEGSLVNGIVVNVRDITERTRAEEALQEANEKLRAVIEASPLAIITLDARNCVTSWNNAAERILGWTEPETVGGPLLSVPENERADFEERMVAARRGETLTGVQVRHRRKNGSLIDLSIWTAVLRRPGGSGLVIAMADITERKRLEEQFRQAQKMDAVGRLAGGVAHDFNNLLTVITGYCQLVMSRLEEADPMHMEMEQVLKAAERAAGLTKQLLAFSRRQIIQSKVIDPNGMLREMKELLRRLLGEDIDLRFALAPNIGCVKVDPGQLGQVVVNLAVNARDAMPQGGRLTIETANVQLDSSYTRRHLNAEPGRYVLIAVSDNGTGIDPEHVPHLFEPFFTTKEKGKGTGLGLSTSYGIVRQNNGHLDVYSELGVGSTFKVYLPRVDEPIETSGPATPARALPRGTETILVVEDEDDVRGVVETMLRRQGYEVLVARGGAEATQLFEMHREQIALLLTDVVMPGQSGRDLAGKLREIVPDLKVLFVSGYTDNAIVHHGVLEPGMAFLQKPFAHEELAAKVRQVLDQQ